MHALVSFILCFTFCQNIKAQTLDTFIDVGHHKLHFSLIRGKGLPILFESGNGDDATVWKSLALELHSKTNATVITYDRSGLGDSELDTARVSFKNEVRDLKVALKKLGYSKEIFIVCHSFGGYYTALFVNKYRKSVKGVVCIEIAPPCFFTKEWAKDFLNTIRPEDWQMIKKFKPGLYYAVKQFPATAEYMENRFFNVPTPVTMIMAEKIQPMIKESEKDKWIACCKAFGAMANHKYVIAQNAGHKVWEKNPEVVINEVMALYNEVTKMSSSK